jgi:protein TonB
MELNKIMNADLIDILFDGKNKEYGAYELRKTYNKRITIAMTGMAIFCLLFILTQLLANDKGKLRNTIEVTDLHLPNFKTEETPEPLPVKPPKAIPEPVATTQYVTPIIVRDELVTDPPPDIATLDETQIGLNDQDGAKNVDYVAPPVEQSTGVVESPKHEVLDYEKTFYKVEKEARFPGGMEGWKRYLERNLNSNVAADDGAPTGNYTVRVQFIVNKEGEISNVEAIEVPKDCPGCGPEAVKIIKKGPRWEPAVQNDRKVNYQAVQYVTFRVSEE